MNCIERFRGRKNLSPELEVKIPIEGQGELVFVFPRLSSVQLGHAMTEGLIYAKQFEESVQDMAFSIKQLQAIFEHLRRNCKSARIGEETFSKPETQDLFEQFDATDLQNVASAYLASAKEDEDRAQKKITSGEGLKAA